LVRVKQRPKTALLPEPKGLAKGQNDIVILRLMRKKGDPRVAFVLPAAA
jgi:hypothetical protein